MTKKLDYTKIKKFPHCPYHVNMNFDYLLEWIDKRVDEDKLELNPDFQRGHVWNEEQQIKFIEFILMDGNSGREIYFNHPGWQDDYRGTMQLVDGLQRVTAIRKFMNDELPIFGGYTLSQIENLKMADHRMSMSIHVNSLQTRKEVLEWYIFMNSGIAHTKEEIDRVKGLIEDEKR